MCVRCYWAYLLVVSAIGAEPCTGKVVGISDGYTLSVMRDGTAVKVRLYGINTPEKGQAFSTTARQFTSVLAYNKTVMVAVKSHDRYGRLIGNVLLPDGRSLSEALVKAGYAWWYRMYVPKDTQLAQLEAEARQAKRGLRSDPHAVPP